MHIAIAGNIGSGKTTLTNLLARHYGWTPKYEQVENNPYLSDYYKDIHRWAFNLEVFFLKERFRDQLAIVHSAENIVQDRSIYEGVYVFAANNKAMGNMDDRDFETYMELFDNMINIIKYPDLMIYLRCSLKRLMENIQQRNRDYEMDMPIGYLEQLNRCYDDFIFNKYKGDVMVVEADNFDFLYNSKDPGTVIDRIDARLYGLFSNHVSDSDHGK